MVKIVRININKKPYEIPKDSIWKDKKCREILTKRIVPVIETLEPRVSDYEGLVEQVLNQSYTSTNQWENSSFKKERIANSIADDLSRLTKDIEDKQIITPEFLQTQCFDRAYRFK